MRKLLITFASVALLLTTACDKDDKNNNPYGNGYGYAPNSCYTSGQAAQYRWANGQCIDVRTNTPTPNVQLCQQAQFGMSYDPRCNTYGGFNNGIPGGGYGFGYGPDQCSAAYGPGWVTSRGVMGELVCVNAATWGYIQNYGMMHYGAVPYNYGGYHQTCIPGNSRCNCQSFGGTLGWVSGGAQVGYCF